MSIYSTHNKAARQEERAAYADRQNNWRDEDEGVCVLIEPDGTEGVRCNQAYAERYCKDHPGWTWSFRLAQDD